MSVLLTVKVDDELKNQVSTVLEELGLDAPTAIRMYLKSIVRENGLPISTTLTAAPAAAPTAPAASTPAALDEGKSTLVKKVTVEEAVAPVGKTVTVDELFEEELPTPVAEETDATEPATEKPKADQVESVVTIDYDTRAGRKAIAQIFIDTILAVPEGKLTRWSDMEAKLTAQYGTEVKRPANIRWPATTEDGTEIPYWRIVGERGAVRGDKMIDMDVQKAKLEAEGHTFESAGHGIFTGIKVAGYKAKLV